MKWKNRPGRSAATRWLDPEDLRLQEEFRRLLGIPSHLRVPLISRIEGDRIWLSRDMRGGSCLLPALVGAGVLGFVLAVVIAGKESLAVAVLLVLAIAALLTLGITDRMFNPCTVLIDIGEGAFYRLGRWRWRPGPVRRFFTQDLHLLVQSAALYGWSGGETPQGMLVSAVSPHPDESASRGGPPDLDQFLLISDELKEGRAMAALEPGIAALQRALPWKGVVVRAAYTILGPSE